MMTLAFLQIFSFLLQTATTAPTNLTTVSAEVMPLILIALMLDAVLIV
jgi:hypothetical protein